ncbi:MAG TPA: hypothetical protein VFL73_00045 [Solirubrobacteraceae bacterium]|nr:hypothetical protein [Solirubrobacteraceae bacterium]
MRCLPTAVAAVLLALSSASVASANHSGPDWVASDNVEYLGSIKQDIGLTTGAKVVGDRLFVTSGKNITVYDISKPASPVTLGSLKVNVAWENEEVPTNGKVLAVASDFYSATPSCLSQLAADGCIQLFDVRDPSNIREVGAIPVANHTAECVLDCQWFYGRAGTIVDARGVLDGRAPTVAGNWIDELRTQGVDEQSCHHVREIRPGVMITACRPFVVMTVNPQDAAGASPQHPKVLYTGQSDAFVHSARWPRNGHDRLVLIGGETNFTGRCDGTNGELRTYSAAAVDDGTATTFGGPLDHLQPAGNGTYTDGKPVANHLGCSVHWFQEHPTWRNGGLLALSEYEDGVRFIQVTRDGRMTEQGFFAALGGSSSSAKWAPGGDVVYSLDYDRGIDIIRWKGSHYVPKAHGRGVRRERGRIRGTNGVSRLPVLSGAALARHTALAQQLSAAGWSPGYCRLAALA